MAKKKKKKKRKSGIQQPSTLIQNCHLIGVQYDAKALDTITMLASALEENAAAINALAKVLKASNVHIDSMIKVDVPERIS